MSTVDISDLDLVVLIKALWNNMQPAAFFRFAPISPPPKPSSEEIMETLKSTRYYLDYLNGRCIKTDFSDLTKVNTRLYNRDAGDGAFERIISELRNK